MVEWSDGVVVLAVLQVVLHLIGVASTRLPKVIPGHALIAFLLCLALPQPFIDGYDLILTPTYRLLLVPDHHHRCRPTILTKTPNLPT